FSSDREAVVGYVSTSSVWVVAGSPVCSDGEILSVSTEFEAAAKKRNKRVCYFGAGEKLASCLRAQNGYASVIVGGVPSWQTSKWADTIEGHASMRAQLKRARNKC